IREMKKCFSGFTPKSVEDSLSSYAHQNVRFHNQIIQASHNQKLMAIIRNLFDQMDMVRLHTIVLPGRARKSLAEHQHIIRLIEKRRGKEAEKFLRAHIQSLHEAVLKVPKFRSHIKTAIYKETGLFPLTTEKAVIK
ncbi:MAG: FCD domain-containing protein, partial [Deltaproteobacteria bacterium]|nr:FCD domain-containing protein [Deltaproteobacteria bacterium]